MVAAGVALMCTGVGGPAGVALMSLSGALTSGGISIAQQKHDNGAVDWARVGTEAAIGAIPIPGGGAAKGATTAGREAAETAGREALETTGREVAETTGRETAEQAARTTGEHELSTISTDAAENVGEHASQTNYIYSSRVLNRSAEAGDSFHNFPQSFDEEIILQGQRKVTPGFWEKDVPNLSNDNVMYRLSGEINGHPGIYEIATRPSVSGRTEVIMHRFFNTR